MSDLICNLREKPRLMDFPFRLALVGWTSRHRLTKPSLLMENFVCLSFNRKKYDPTIEDDSNSFGFLPVNTPVAPTMQFHDEVFFSYHPSVTDHLCRLFGSTTRISMRGFPMTNEIKGILHDIRTKLDQLTLPGTADALDAMAIRLIAAILTSYQQYKEENRKVNMDIYELARELRQGASLENLIRKYKFSRRTFYNEWNKVFGISPVQYRLKEALTQAADMLTQTELPIKEICHACGFNDLVYFYQRFRNCYGTSPADYRLKAPKMTTDETAPKAPEA